MLGQVRVRQRFLVLGFNGQEADGPRLFVVWACRCASVCQGYLWWVAQCRTAL